MFDWIGDPDAWVALATLTALEIVLGVDNIIFISILVGRLPEAQRARARLGLALAMVMRIGLLLSLTWVMRLTAPLFTSRRLLGARSDPVGGGLSCSWKACTRSTARSKAGRRARATPARATFAGVLVQIAVIDIVFSLDSVITAVGLVDESR